MIDQRVISAAENNADCYEMMFQLHGLDYKRDALGFRAIDIPPRFHSRLTWCDPEDVGAMLTRIREDKGLPGFGLKDSYSMLDLEHQELELLFEAEWIWCDMAQDSDLSAWELIETAPALLAWETGWNDGPPNAIRQFPDDILDRTDVALWGRRHGAKFDAGCIANLSQNCVGLSNAFGSDIFSSALSLCQAFGDGRPVCGYERGQDLQNVKGAGCESIGPIRVYVV